MEQNSVEKLTKVKSIDQTHSHPAESAVPIFTRKKSLLTPDQYAARQGVSQGIVQECTKLGVVQIRKHKDKTYIVDLPLDTYKLLKQPDSSSEAVATSSSSNKITELVNRIFNPASIAPDLNMEKKNLTDAKQNDLDLHKNGTIGAGAIPDLKLFGDEETKAENINIRIPEIGFRVSPMRNVTDSIRTKSMWKISFVFAAFAFALSFIAYTSVSIEKKDQQQKLQQAYDSIDKLISKYEQTKQQVKTTEFDMLTWRSEAEEAKKALLNTENELQNTRKSLFESKKELQTIQETNSERLKELNEQITKIREHIPAVQQSAK